MTYTELLSRIMEKLEDTWPPAAGIRLLIAKGVIDEESAVKLVAVFEHAIAETENEEHKVKFQKAIDTTKKLQELEKHDRHYDAAEIAQLEEMLEQI